VVPADRASAAGGSVSAAARRRRGRADRAAPPPLLPAAQAEAFAAFVHERFRRGVGHCSPITAWIEQFQRQQPRHLR